MKDISARMAALMLASLITLSAMALFTADRGLPEAAGMPGRSQTGFIAKDDFYLHTEYDRDALWIVVWMENSITFEAPEMSGSDKFFFFREVANSYAFPVDGGSHMSGEKRRALAELFTATDCSFCPGAEGAFDTLVNERFPDDFSLIEWHRALNPGSDPYETGSSQGRFSSYNVTGSPTAIFDGTVAQVGGDTNPSNSKLPGDYGKKIDRANKEEPLVTFTGRADISGDYLSFNVTFDVINPMPRGNWVIRAAVCEDLQKEHSGAVMRHTPRGTVETKHLTHLQDGFPDAAIDEEATFSGVDRDSVRGNFTIFWEASDPEDGNSLDIDIIIRPTGGSWTPIAQGLENTGHYRWDTANPRTPDGNYQLRLIVSDMSANSILSGNFIRFTIDNPDFPTGNFTYPVMGQSLSGRAHVTWDSFDDEDGAQNLRVRVSISNDSGENYKVISYNLADGSDWIVNMGSYDLNTLNYRDLNTYRLKLDLRDSDDMMTVVESDVFEIYNNDPPSVTVISPAGDSTVTALLDVGYRVEDEEDAPSAIWGNISLKKDGQDRWTVLFEGLLDDEMTNRTFDTATLFGDGHYSLMFTVTDSRGLSASVTREFNIYDPDSPVFNSVTGPANTEDVRSSEIRLSWDCIDADQGETLTFNVYISKAMEENWTRVIEGADGSTASISLLGLEEGLYRFKVKAVDSSPYHLSAEAFYGPIYYNAPDAPEILLVEPAPGKGTSLPWDVNTTLSRGFFILDIVWSVSDRDGDNVTSSIYYRPGTAGEWILLGKGTELSEYGLNLTDMDTGEFTIRIVAADDSADAMESELILGPFNWRNVFKEAPVHGNGGGESPEDTSVSENAGSPDWTLFAGIAGAVIVVVVLLVLLALFLTSRLRSKKKLTKVIPDQKDMDYNAIPEFQRTNVPSRPIQAPQQPRAQPAAQAPVESEPEPAGIITGNVSWASDDEDEVGEGETMPQTDEGTEEGSAASPEDLPDQVDAGEAKEAAPDDDAAGTYEALNPPPLPPS